MYSHAVLGKIVAGIPRYFAPRAVIVLRQLVDTELEFYFGKWHRAEVSIEEKNRRVALRRSSSSMPGKKRYTKICLTADSDFEIFSEWVELNQATRRSRGGQLVRGSQRVLYRDDATAWVKGRRSRG